MTVTIWHNPKCATSRKVLDMIRAAGVTPQVVDYVKAPPSTAALKAALKAMAMKPRALLRRKGSPMTNCDSTTPPSRMPR
jgi:arsenate reductase (glutaredoxin)